MSWNSSIGFSCERKEYHSRYIGGRSTIESLNSRMGLSANHAALSRSSQPTDKLTALP